MSFLPGGGTPERLVLWALAIIIILTVGYIIFEVQTQDDRLCKEQNYTGMVFSDKGNGGMWINCSQLVNGTLEAKTT